VSRVNLCVYTAILWKTAQFSLGNCDWNLGGGNFFPIGKGYKYYTTQYGMCAEVL